MNLRIYTTKNGTIVSPYKRGLLRSVERSTSSYDHVYHKSVEETGFLVNNFGGGSAFITHSVSPELLLPLIDRGYTLYKMPWNIPKPLGSRLTLQIDTQLRDYQGDIVVEIMQTSNHYHEWFINLQTDMGKTITGIELIHQFGTKAMVVCFRNVILNQWKEKLMDKTTAVAERIHFINGSKELEKMYNGEFPTDDYDIYLVNPATLTSYFRSHDYRHMHRIFDELGIGTLIYDEAHRNMGLVVKMNATTNTRATIYLSADYAQGELRREDRYYDIFKNTKIIRMEKDQAEEYKHTKILVVDFDTKPSVNDTVSINNKYGYSADNYMKYEFKKGRILEVLRHLVENIIKTRKPEYRTLIFFTNKWAADEAYNYLSGFFADSGVTFGEYHGDIPEDHKEWARKKADVLIATYSSLNTGFDEENIKYVIGTNQSNKIEDNQTSGRGRPMKDGTDNVYMMLVDVGFSYCKKKLRQRLGYLMETKAKDRPVWYHM